eukprot:423815-Rhodomonas_salina.1
MPGRLAPALVEIAKLQQILAPEHGVWRVALHPRMFQRLQVSRTSAPCQRQAWQHRTSREREGVMKNAASGSRAESAMPSSNAACHSLIIVARTWHPPGQNSTRVRITSLRHTKTVHSTCSVRDLIPAVALLGLDDEEGSDHVSVRPETASVPSVACR